jgi:hypothetical protein
MYRYLSNLSLAHWKLSISRFYLASFQRKYLYRVILPGYKYAIGQANVTSEHGAKISRLAESWTPCLNSSADLKRPQAKIILMLVR